MSGVQQGRLLLPDFRVISCLSFLHQLCMCHRYSKCHFPSTNWLPAAQWGWVSVAGGFTTYLWFCSFSLSVILKLSSSTPPLYSVPDLSLYLHGPNALHSLPRAASEPCILVVNMSLNIWLFLGALPKNMFCSSPTLLGQAPGILRPCSNWMSGGGSEDISQQWHCLVQDSISVTEYTFC